MKKLSLILLLILQFLALNVFCDDPPGKKCPDGGDNNGNNPGTEQPDDHPADSTDVDVQDPSDPNEIIGTRGYDALGDTLQWVAATASLPYTIYFENDPELATAAAQKVEVRHRLHTKADISTFAIGAFGFGSHVFTVEGNRSSYQQRLDLTQDMGIYVDVVAGIDIVAGEAFWILQSIDPATGLPPQGTQQGFLPVNDENHSGEGYVSFTIKPKANACVTGDELTASASIVFDINEAISTNVWHNTVDALPPTTHLVGTEGGDNEIVLQFSGQDDEGGCGIKQYKLYVSDNYGAYSLYDTYPVGSEATYPTEYDHCYRFFCLGEDNVGNVEAMKEAEVEIGGVTFAQTNTLTSGWNWWSTYIDMSTDQDFNKLKIALGSNASMIKSRSDGFVTYMMNDWYGTLQTIDNKSMYMINMNSEETISITGVLADLTSNPITINNGWNWIGFPSNVNVDINSALVNLTPTESDLIKTRNAFATYYSAMGGWFGSLTSLTPGLGYMYKSNNTEPFEFVYSTVSRYGTEPVEEQMTNHWEVSVGEYSDNATLIGVIAINGEEQRDENLIVGAFVGDRCVGEANALYFEAFDRCFVFLTYFGDENDEITFRLFDESTGIETIGAETSLVFNANSTMGTLDDPYIINFGVMGVEELANEVKMFPNPVMAGEKLKVSLKDVDATSMKIEVVNALGMVVYQNSYHSVSTDITVPSVPGIYIVKITGSNGNMYNGKLIVE